MLIQFAVQNFRSFYEKVTLNMLADSSDKMHPYHLIADVPKKGSSVLRACAIYGANASGKSNLIRAIGFARQFIVNGTRPRQPTGVDQFKLAGSDRDLISTFEFIFKTEDVEYEFGFRLDTSKVYEEWLFAKRKRQSLIYHRLTQDDGKAAVDFGSSLAGRSIDNSRFLKYVAEGTRPNQLFLTETVEKNIDALRPVLSWFRDGLEILEPRSRPVGIESRFGQSSDFASFLKSLLAAADTGIDGAVTEEQPINIERVVEGFDDEARVDTLAMIERLEPGFFLDVYDQARRRKLIILRHPSGELVTQELKMLHQVRGGGHIEFDSSDESAGTQRLIDLAPALVDMRDSVDKVLIVDELEASLHPLISALFLNIALETRGDGRQNQLIFTTHDTNLLDIDLLRRDEVWFVQKGRDGSSKLYSLAEFRIRPDLKIEKGYLNGRFGAIPLVGDLAEPLPLNRSPDMSVGPIPAEA